MKLIKYVVVSLALSVSGHVVAQDIIVTHESGRIDAKIVEVSDNEVKYKKSNSPDGPTFVLETAKIASVIYANGEVQTFEKTKKNRILQSGESQRVWYYKGIELNLTPTLAVANGGTGFSFGIGLGRRFSEKFYGGLSIRIQDFGSPTDNMGLYFVGRPYHPLNSVPFDVVADIMFGYENVCVMRGDIEYLAFKFIPGIEYPLTSRLDLRIGIGFGASIVLDSYDVPGVHDGDASGSFLIQATLALHGKRRPK